MQKIFLNYDQQIEKLKNEKFGVNNGQKPIDIRPTARYNIVNLIGKPGAPSTGRAPKGALQR